MKFTEWLDAEKGRTKAVAEHFNVSPGAITQWRIAIPRNRMRELHTFTQDAVGYDEMIPDTPEPNDLQSTLDQAGRDGLIERRSFVHRGDDGARNAELEAINAGKGA